MKKMKTIYICSEYFAPYQAIASIRFSKIAKYLSKNHEYRIIIFSRKNSEFATDSLLQEDLEEIEQNNGRVFFVDSEREKHKTHTRLYYWTNRICRGIWSRIISSNKRMFLDCVVSAKRFNKNALNIIESNHLPKPDIIISTHGDFGGHYLARSLKKQWGENVVWISDFRDQVLAGIIKKGVFRKLCDRYSYLVTKESDYTTAVSEGVLKDMKIYSKSATRIISLGFDHEDYEKVAEDGKKFHLVYTGSFYGQLRTLIPVFRAIRELIDEGKVKEKFIAIEYAGENGTLLYNEICRFGLERCWVNWGSVNRYQSILLQERGDVLLTAVWNSIDYQGVMGGKTLGYLMLNKPIIAIVGGDLGDSDMKRFVEETNCGICYEHANHRSDFKKLKEQLLKYYMQKIKEGKVTQKYSKITEKYNYRNISKQYEEIMNSCLTRPNKKGFKGSKEDYNSKRKC